MSRKKKDDVILIENFGFGDLLDYALASRLRALVREIESRGWIVRVYDPEMPKSVVPSLPDTWVTRIQITKRGSI